MDFVDHRYVFLGPQGSGKGTQAKQLAHELGVPHVSSGHIFRQEMAKGTALGEKVRAAIVAGHLVPDAETNGVIQDLVRRDTGYVLDGYPRNLVQARFLEYFARPLRVILLTLTDDEALQRLGGRLACTICGDMYHVVHRRPAIEGKCDRCGGSLETRADDTEAAIRQRLRLYHEHTEPLIDFYADRLLTIDAAASILEVGARIREGLHL